VIVYCLFKVPKLLKKKPNKKTEGFS